MALDEKESDDGLNLLCVYLDVRVGMLACLHVCAVTYVMKLTCMYLYFEEMCCALDTKDGRSW